MDARKGEEVMGRWDGAKGRWGDGERG